MTEQPNPHQITPSAPKKPTNPDPDYTLADQARMSLATNYFEWQAKLVLPALGRRIVEVGCGIGNFTRRMLDRELVVAVDIEPACLATLRQRYPAVGNLVTSDAVLGTPEWLELAHHQPDSCVCLNVLEHIEDDRLALESMAAILPPGGVIVLLVPAFPALYGEIDRKLGHFRRYTRKSLRALAESVGLEVARLNFMNSIGFFAWWANSHLLRRTEQSTGQIGVFDKLVVPVLSRVESILPPPFGQSLFAVLRKRV